ncbi:S-layer homology domain-containing protein [Paenibacillus sp. J2TS4]|uniref:S-layer homology domain-containing protein n=1 Tax=Paenibacillus sp. J2TS4 TaxID=2807194 RepID=UPI001B097664|nr:S-layer homology domain-containing protein [Paenibacillus sp. J2TS4]GIP30820.1 hypothetical protein J2TS4_00300 [Paenibacillus sp. J2TS4]
MNKKGLFITLIVAVSMAVFLLGKFEKVDAASNLLENKESGDVVKFAGVEWVLLNPSERYIVMKDYWLKDGKQVTAPFNTKKTNKFDPSQKENIGYILNTEYYNTLSNIEKGMVVESVWDISPFLGVGIQTVRAKIGLLSLREWLEYKSVLGNPSWVFWTLTPHPQNNEQVFAIGADGNSYAWSTWKPEWPTVTHPALKLKPGVFVNPLTSELQPLEDDNNPPTISFEPNGNTTKQKVHSTKVWVYDWFGSGVEEATYRWKKGNQYVTGNIRMNEYPMIINTPDNGDGEYYLEVTAVDAAGNRSSQVSKPFVVGSLEVTSVNPLADISVDYGTTRSALPLPSTVQVTLSDQSIRSLGVTWDDGTPVYDGNTAGEYTFTGTLSQDVSNPQGLTAEVKVVVHPKPAEPPVVSSVESLNDIEVSYGTERSALPLPPTVLVILSDQTSQSLGVTWDDGTPVYDGNAAGEYTFTGTLGTERSALPLPPTVLVILSDQTSQSLGVTWDDGSPAYNGNTVGEYTFTGTLAQDVSNPQGLTAKVKMVVRPFEPDTEAPQWPDDSELTVSDVTQTSVKLSWPSATDNVGVTGYRIYVDDFEYKTAGGNENALIVNDLTAETSYTFKVTAYDEAGNESAGLTASAKTLPQPTEPDTEAPQWPDGSELMVSDVTQTSVKLSWPSATDNVGVTGYRIYVDDFEYKTAGGSENAIIVTGLTAKTSYMFKVTAHDEAGNESATLSASAKTLPQPMEPDTEAPRWPDGSELTVSDITQTSVKLTWPSAIDNVGVTGYRIYVDEVEYKAVGGNVKGTMINGLATNTSYTFKVTAYDAVGNESTSLSKQATTAQSSSGGGGTGGSGSGGGRVLSSNADLQELQVWDKDKKLELSPSFAAGTTSFTARTQAEQVEIMVKPVHFAAKVMLKEKEITDRTKEHLEEGDNTFVLTVQAENGTKKKYTLTIYRETPKPYEPVIEFTDIAGHWAENHIKRAAAKGIVSGYPDGTFQPNHPVTRAEFTVMLTGALRLEEKGAALTFNDNDQIGAWAKQAVAQAVQAGIIDGYEDGSFRPNASVTRAEMAVMVAQAIKRPLKAHTTTGFVDDEAIPQWAKGSVEAIRGLSIVSGRAGNKFVPNDTMTRAEAATILLRMVDILK